MILPINPLLNTFAMTLSLNKVIFPGSKGQAMDITFWCRYSTHYTRESKTAPLGSILSLFCIMFYVWTFHINIWISSFFGKSRGSGHTGTAFPMASSRGAEQRLCPLGGVCVLQITPYPPIPSLLHSLEPDLTCQVPMYIWFCDA